LREREQSKVPIDWATTQNNLGAALWSLAARNDDPGLLADAAQAYQASLLVYTRNSHPLFWATTQNNLGAVYWELGKASGDKSHLVAAVNAYRNALEERDQNKVPIEWATTQNNLAAVLRFLGTQTQDVVLLQEALKALQEAHRVFREQQATEFVNETQTAIELTQAAIRRVGHQ
jgi:tetratricopeptide (TPR) repeat protein